MITVWLRLCSDTKAPSPSVSVIRVDTNPALRFPHSDVLNNIPLPSANPSTTPVVTPLASTFSPDQSGLVSTPGGSMAQASAPTPTSGPFDDNAEAMLIDITDETWGLTMARGLDDPNIPTAFCQALASGYLLKRAGPRDEDGLRSLEVNIVYAPKPDKALLKDLLSMYRGLALLARVRGIVDPISNVLPWHIAAAKKAHAVVSGTMQWAGETAEASF